ncbi:MAG: hypothetical protein B7Z47_01240 [Chthoniobacter sp. 12-60-6]|nr:MAG: hypothetical protein B7Z47_01240 [Chthoniobacter sp. 12-60-6]
MSTIAQTIDRRLSQLPPSRAARLELLILRLLDFAEPEPTHNRAEPDEAKQRVEALAALNRIASRGGIAGIDDPVSWQRAQRTDRSLPGREP